MQHDSVVLHKGKKVYGPNTSFACMNWYHRHDGRPIAQQSDFKIVERPLINSEVQIPISNETVETTASRMSKIDSRYNDMSFINKCLRNPETKEEKSFASRFSGVMAELQICDSMHGVFSDTYKTASADKGWDMEIHDLKIDIKTTFFYEDSWTIKKRKYDSDILLFTNVSLDPRSVTLRGFLEPSELVYCDRIKDIWRVKSSRLRPLRELSI